MHGLDFRTFTCTGKMSFDRVVATHTLPDHIAYCLREAGGTVIEVQHDRIAFKAGLFRLDVSPWKAALLSPFDSGILTLDSGAREIAYRLSFGRLAIVATAMAVAMWLGALLSAIWLGAREVASGLKWYSLIEALELTVLWWALYVGLGLLWGIPSFSRFVRIAAAGAPKYAQPTMKSG